MQRVLIIYAVVIGVCFAAEGITPDSKFKYIDNFIWEIFMFYVMLVPTPFILAYFSY